MKEAELFETIYSEFAYLKQAEGADYLTLLRRFIRDLVFHCSINRLGEVYEEGKFWISSYSQPLLSPMIDAYVGNFHTSDLFPIFENTLWKSFYASATPQQRNDTLTLSFYMQSVWVNLAKCGSPTCGAGLEGSDFEFLREWKPFHIVKNPTYLSFRLNSTAENVDKRKPFVRAFEENNIYSTTDRFSDECPSLKKCRFLSTLNPIKFKNFKEDLKIWLK